MTTTQTPLEMSRSPTVTDDTTSPSRTLTDLTAVDPAKANSDKFIEPAKPVHHLPAESTIGIDQEKLGLDVAEAVPNVLASLPPARKNILLMCFCAAMFIDAAGVSATFLMTAPIGVDLDIDLGNYAWILGTYSLAFASTLLFAGRLADLYPPHIIYNIGFVGLAIFYLIISFMNNEYAFFVLRAISALLAVWTIPSAINMIIQMYPDPLVQAGKLALFGMAGALANTIALVLAGVFLLASWRWYFRFITIIIAPFSVMSWFLMPKTQAVASNLPGAEKWKRMDLGGVFILVSALVCFILAFTQASISGWKSAIFIAPLVVAVVLFGVFIVYEQWLPRGYALLPHDIWRFPNIFPLMIQASAGFLWFATVQLRFATYWQDALGNSPILAAVKLLPMGITALFVGGVTQALPWMINRPRYMQPIASLLCFAGSMLFAFSHGGGGNDFWRYVFPGEIIGTTGGMILFIGMNNGLIQSFPVEAAGVGGSFAQIVFQIGGVIGISIQQGLVGTPTDIKDWTGSRNGYFFAGAYVLVTGAIFVSWFRQYKMPKHESPIAAA